MAAPRSRGTRFLAGGALVIGGIAAGCVPGSLRYAPRHPLQARVGGLRGEVSSLETAALSPRARIDAEISAPGERPLGLTGAWLGSARDRPCAAGTPAGIVAVDGRWRWERPVLLSDGRSPARVSFQFADRTWLDAQSNPAGAVLDLAAAETAPGGGPSCLRMALTDPALTLRWRVLDGWTLGTALEISGAAYQVLIVGRWWGPLRIGGEAGVRLFGCRTDCEGTTFAYRPLRGSLGVGLFPIQRSFFALGVEAGWEPAWRGDSAGPRFGQAVRATLRLSLISLPDLGLPSGARAGSIWVGLTLLHWLSPGWSDGPGGAFSLGGELPL